MMGQADIWSLLWDELRTHLSGSVPAKMQNLQPIMRTRICKIELGALSKGGACTPHEYQPCHLYVKAEKNLYL